MRRTFFLACAAAATAMAAAGGAARADLQVVQKTVIQCPGLSQMLQEIPAEQRGPLMKMVSPMVMGTPWITTTYLKGQEMRTDMGATSVVVNAASGRALTINRQTHRYSVGPYDPIQSAAGTFTCHISPTSETAPMLGHRVRRYLISLTSSVLPKSQISGEIWAAPDLPTPPASELTGATAAEFESEMAKVKGMPLAYMLHYRNTPAGDISVVSYATSLKETPLMASLFRAPAGYAEGTTRTATATPSSGFPLGDGMPLDGIGALAGEVASAPPAEQGPIDLNKLIDQANGKAEPSSAGGPGRTSLGGLSQLMGGAGSAEGLGGMGGGDAGQMLSGMSGADLSKLLGMLGGAGGAGGSAGNMSSLLNPQALAQLQAELQSLLSDED